MNCLKKSTAFIICFFNIIIANGQISDSLYKALSDSLKPVKKTNVTYPEIIRILEASDWAFIYRFPSEFDQMSRQLQKQFPNIKADEEKMTYAHAVANYYAMSNNTPEAMYWHKLVIAEGEATEKKYHPNLLGDAYLTVGIFLSQQKKQDSAIELIQKATDVALANHDNNTLNYTYYSSIPIYTGLALFQQALYYTNKFLDSQPVKWKGTYTEIASIKGLLYAYIYRDSKKPEYADSAINAIHAVMAANKKDEDFWYGPCYGYLAMVAYYQADYKKAILYFDSAFLPQYNKKGSLFSNWKFRFELYRAMAMLKMGRQEGMKELLSVKIPPGDFTTYQELNEVLSVYYAKQGDYKKALKYYSLYKVYTDSTNLIGHRGKVFEITQKYAVAQKEAAIAVLENKNLSAQATRNTILFAATIIILLLFTIFYIRNRRQKFQRALALVNQRKAISANMHDEVSSGLVALRFLVSDLKEKLVEGTLDIDEAMQDIEEEVNTVYTQSRSFMHQINSEEIKENYNVIGLLNKLALRYGEGSNLIVETDIDETNISHYFTQQQHTELSLVIKEALSNCMKYSGANTFYVTIHQQNNYFKFEISDNGKGLGDIYSSDGIGFSSIKKRIALLKGNVKISNGKTGTSIIGSFPIKP